VYIQSDVDRMKGIGSLAEVNQETVDYIGKVRSGLKAKEGGDSGYNTKIDLSL
jgi:hypothetical protein